MLVILGSFYHSTISASTFRKCMHTHLAIVTAGHRAYHNYKVSSQLVKNVNRIDSQKNNQGHNKYYIRAFYNILLANYSRVIFVSFVVRLSIIIFNCLI